MEFKPGEMYFFNSNFKPTYDKVEFDEYNIVTKTVPSMVPFESKVFMLISSRFYHIPSMDGGAINHIRDRDVWVLQILFDEKVKWIICDTKEVKEKIFQLIGHQNGF